MVTVYPPGPETLCHRLRDFHAIGTHVNIYRICNGRFREEEFVACESCGEQYHESCLEYHTSYEYTDCAEDLAVGAVEF
jgi:hypothetical protein